MVYANRGEAYGKGGTYMKENSVPISEKYALSIREASEYFSIGIKNMRRLAEDHSDSFAVWNGNRYLIIRTKFEEYLISCLNTKKGGEDSEESGSDGKAAI